jgi:hypothetical protein
MTPDRFKRLNDIGFVWDPVADEWDAGFAKLEQFKTREGYCRVPTGHIEDGYKLGFWVALERKSRKLMLAERGCVVSDSSPDIIRRRTHSTKDMTHGPQFNA